MGVQARTGLTHLSGGGGFDPHHGMSVATPSHQLLGGNGAYDTPLVGTPENIRVHGEIATAAFRLLPDPQAVVHGHVEKICSLHALISSDRGYVTPVREIHRNALKYLCCLPQPPRTRNEFSQLLAAASGTDDYGGSGNFLSTLKSWDSVTAAMERALAAIAGVRVSARATGDAVLFDEVAQLRELLKSYFLEIQLERSGQNSCVRSVSNSAR